MSAPPPFFEPPPFPNPEHEMGRARARRVALGIARPSSSLSADQAPDPAASAQGGQWALALSGGGIRSATFCLGVLQGMAKVRDPGASPGPHPAATASGTPASAGEPAPPTSHPAVPAPTHWPLLAQFDYLSTVSGGGYIGGFFSSLFVRGRLSGHKQETALETTERAYTALKEEPPGRIHRDTNYDPNFPGRAALAWLRDNGRYMAPSATGDLLYGIAIAVRNWFATQYVVATMIVMLLSALQAGRWGLSTYWPWWRDWEATLLDNALHSDSMIWWSPSWTLGGVLAMLTALPLGIAYWFSHPAAGKDLGPQMAHLLGKDHPRDEGPGSNLQDHLAAPPLYWTVASLLGLLMGITLCFLGWHAYTALGRLTMGKVLGGLGVSVVLSIAWYMWTTFQARRSPQGSITLQRVLLTRWLTASLVWLLAVGGLAAIETLAQTAWLWLSARHGAAVSGVLAVLVWLMRVGAQRLDAKPGPEREGARARLPVGLLAGIVGGLLWITVAAALDILLLQVAWPEGWANPKVLWEAALAAQAFCYAVAALGLSALMALVVGRFPGFLNLSTLQSLYSARIIRAYLGATNHARFTPDAGGEARDVAEPIKGDSLSADDIHRNPLAPIHFVNVCVNQSVSPGEQLIQRDRKGKPLVVAPGGVYFDNHAHALGCGSDESELCFPLSFGEWLGVSGAAFSTGLGRGTGLGMSLALGFANVRLGRWWKGVPAKPGTRETFAQKLFTTQSYLLDELQGKFYGDHRPYQYLSDGGHFENMAVYELLRPERDRQIRLIVVCDCGCDPDYDFQDLANLTRLVRIDHGLEIRVNRRARGETLLNQVFANPEDFARGPDGGPPERSGRCAILLDVLGTERSTIHGIRPGALHARILLIKPTLLENHGVDIDHYRSGNAAFPQETTMDQFFDEAQWESYRQLGVRVAQRVFTADGMPGYQERLWAMCLDGLSS